MDNGSNTALTSLVKAFVWLLLAMESSILSRLLQDPRHPDSYASWMDNGSNADLTSVAARRLRGAREHEGWGLGVLDGARERGGARLRAPERDLKEASCFKKTLPSLKGRFLL